MIKATAVRLKPSFVFFAIIIVVSIILFNGLGKTPIYILDEARNAQCAREMMQRNDWVVPTFNEELRIQKPPLHYYGMIVAYHIFGVNAFAARFFSALLGILLIVITFLFVKKIKGSSVALLTILILASSTHLLFEFRLSVPDPYLIFFFTLTMLSLYGYLKSEKALPLYLASVAMALAVLSKGPVALGLAGVPVLVWMTWEKKLKLIWKPQMLVAALLFVSITLPWYWLVHQKTNGAFTNGFFLEQNLNRFSQPMEGHGGWFILVPLFVWVGLLPFSSFLMEASKKFKTLFKDPFIKYSVLIAAWVLIVFSISETKLPNYPMLCYPFIAIWLAQWAYNAYQERQLTKSYPIIVLISLNFLLAIGVFIALKNEPTLKGYEWWAFIFVAVSIGCFLVLRNYRQQLFTNALIVLAVLYAIFNFLFLGFTYPLIYQNNPVTKSLPIIEGKKLYAYGLYNPSFNFHTKEAIPNLTSVDRIDSIWKMEPDALIVAREKNLANLDSTFSYQVVWLYKDIFENSTTVILKKPE